MPKAQNFPKFLLYSLRNIFKKLFRYKNPFSVVLLENQEKKWTELAVSFSCKSENEISIFGGNWFAEMKKRQNTLWVFCRFGNFCMLQSECTIWVVTLMLASFFFTTSEPQARDFGKINL